MIEIPEANTLAAQLTETVKGKTITNVIANSSPHGFAFYYGDPALYHERLSGRTCGGARAVGGIVAWEAEDCLITFNDGVNIRYYAPGEELPQKHQLHIQFEDESSLVCTVQMYGGMMAYPKGEENSNTYYQIAREKPSPLTGAFDEGYFAGIRKAAKPTLSVKALLATEQRIPGLGNGVLQDILFAARLHPKAKVGGLTGPQLERLFCSVRQTLFEMTAKGGRDTEKDLFGTPGGYKTVLSGKTLDAPCPACGGAIARQAYMGGNVYFCPHCQPLA